LSRQTKACTWNASTQLSQAGSPLQGGGGMHVALLAWSCVSQSAMQLSRDASTVCLQLIFAARQGFPQTGLMPWHWETEVWKSSIQAALHAFFSAVAAALQAGSIAKLVPYDMTKKQMLSTIIAKCRILSLLFLYDVLYDE